MVKSVDIMVAEAVMKRFRKQVSFGEVDPRSPDDVFESFVKIVKMSHPEDFMHAFMSVVLYAVTDAATLDIIGDRCAGGLVEISMCSRSRLRSVKTHAGMLCCFM
jgi:hypothetical protein